MSTSLGACASGDPLSAAAGRDVLRAGGNAVDAAVAAVAMAAFTLPTMTGLGGAGVLAVRAGSAVEVLDCFAALPGLGGEVRPRPPARTVYVSFEGVERPFHVGPATVAVPGLVAGLWALHERHGRVPLSELLAPAIRAARRGAPMTDGQYRAFDILQEIFRASPAAWDLVGDEDGIRQVGEPLENPALADTLELLVREGPRAFYEGDVAAGIVAATDGLVTREDLARYRATWRAPLEGSYRGRRLYAPAAPSFSGALLLLGLRHLEAGGPLPVHFDPPAWGRVADAIRHGDRHRTAAYESSLFEEGFLARVVATGPSGQTMHCATIDAEGTAVSWTSTVGEGAGLVPEGRGFVLNNFLGEEDLLSRGAPRAAGERMMTGMCPTLLETPDDRWLALGSAGSARIRSALLQVICHVVDGGAHLQEAIGRPRIHAEGDTLYVEGFGRGRRQVEALRPYGRDMVATWAPGFFFGGAQAVGRTPDGFDAGAEVARRGAAAYLA